jgi:hypothetical protein
VEIAAFLPAEITQPAPHDGKPRLALGIGLATASHEEADAPHPGRLRARPRGRERRARYQRQNVPASYDTHLHHSGAARVSHGA